MSASLDKGDIIQSFMAITSESSIENATYLLEAANYSIDDAVNLFFSQDNSSSSIPVGNLSYHFFQ